MRILALDDALDKITIHYEDGTSEEFDSWNSMLKNIDLADVESYNDLLGDYWHNNGVPPLTAYPRTGTTQRPEGEGCLNCRFFSGCLAIQKYKGDMNYSRADGGRGVVGPRNGIACLDYEAGS